MQRLITRGRSADLAKTLHDRPVLGYGFALGTFLVALAVRLYFQNSLPPGLPFITFLPGVLFVAFFAGRGPAIAMSLVSGLTAWYLFLSPEHSLVMNRAILMALAFYLFVATIAITMIQTLRQTTIFLEKERENNAALADQRAFLFRELQHRVANNMAFLVAILSLQKNIVRQRPRASEEVLDDAIRRIRLFSSIHRRLHDPEAASLAQLDTHFRNLFNDLIEATGASNVHCKVVIDNVTLSGETLMTLSLIATELMTNAIKHAFPDDREGEISLYLGRMGDDIVFIVSDNGVGKTDVCGDNPGLGCTIVEALCDQLAARRRVHGNNGTHVEISFPSPKDVPTSPGLQPM